jgi:autophagy-related protein 33
VSTAKTHLRTLSVVSSSSFLFAYILSPRLHRHPYLLYTTFLVAGSSLVTSDYLAPYFFITKAPSSSNSTASQTATRNKKQQEKQERARMEASYEVLGASEAQIDKAESDELTSDEEFTQINGEEVRTEVEGFLKKQAVQTVVSGLGFLMAVVGIWGDGVTQVFQNDVLVVEI